MSQSDLGAPDLLYPGLDTLKEAWPHPFFNAAHQRGMHVLSFDGPGQAESNLRGIRLTADNYEDAASTALDYLQQGVGAAADWRLRDLA